jgi:hypothetical protein
MFNNVPIAIAAIASRPKPHNVVDTYDLLIVLSSKPVKEELAELKGKFRQVLTFN